MSTRRTGPRIDPGATKAQEVKHFVDLRSSERYVVALLKNTVEKLYFHPKDKTPESDELWFRRLGKG